LAYVVSVNEESFQVHPLLDPVLSPTPMIHAGLKDGLLRAARFYLGLPKQQAIWAQLSRTSVRILTDFVTRPG
jgi:hypothetical protein